MRRSAWSGLIRSIFSQKWWATSRTMWGDGGVVSVGGPAGEVVDEQLPHRPVADRIAVHQLLNGELATGQRRTHRGRCFGWEVAHLVQDVPGRRAGEPVGVLLPRAEDRSGAAGLVPVV